MILDCLLDDCPTSGKTVDYRKCCSCQYNPLGTEQADFGRQQCDHPAAKHDPRPERWIALKSAAGVLHLTLVG
jgi:hypothetical protein